MERSDCILVYGNTTKGDVVKRSDCILVYGSTTKGGVVKRFDCILVYGSTTKGGVVERSECILVYGSQFILHTYIHISPQERHLREAIQTRQYYGSHGASFIPIPDVTKNLPTYTKYYRQDVAMPDGLIRVSGENLGNM